MVILPIPDVQAYLDRYSLPDKAAAGKQTAESWPVPYWDLDAAMSVMLMLLTAEDEGLGALVTGIFANEREMLDSLGVPANRRPIGLLGLGHVHSEGHGNPGSAKLIPKRKPSEVIHWGRWWHASPTRTSRSGCPADPSHRPRACRIPARCCRGTQRNARRPRRGQIRGRVGDFPP